MLKRWKWLMDTRAHAAYLYAAGFPFTVAIRMAWEEGRKWPQQ